MSQWKYITVGVALAAGLALGSVGCMGDTSGTSDEAVTAHDGDVAVGEAHQAWSPAGGPFCWFAGWGGNFPWWGKSWLCGPFGGGFGCGLGGFGGCF